MVVDGRDGARHGRLSRISKRIFQMTDFYPSGRCSFLGHHGPEDRRSQNTFLSAPGRYESRASQGDRARIFKQGVLPIDLQPSLPRTRATGKAQAFVRRRLIDAEGAKCLPTPSLLPKPPKMDVDTWQVVEKNGYDACTNPRRSLGQNSQRTQDLRLGSSSAWRILRFLDCS